MMLFLFWFSSIFIFYTYIGYFLFLKLLSVLIKKPVNKKEFINTVSIIIAVYNEEESIQQKILNCLSLDYPKDKYEILIGSDGSSDHTNFLLKKIINEKVRSIFYDNRRGKVAVLNSLVPKANGEIIVFTDARQKLDKSAIRELVKNFNDPMIGSVSGELILEKEETGIGKSLGFYWRYEKFLRWEESKIDSMVGATGAIYAIRKELYVPMPDDTLLDDLYIPMQIVKKGYRTIYDPSAKAYDKVCNDMKEEEKRKIRTLAGNWQLFMEGEGLLNPFRNRIAFQLISHKLLRIMAPFILLTLFISNFFILDSRPYLLFFILQVLFYVMAFIGFFLKKNKMMIFDIPYAFFTLNSSAIKGLYYYLTDKQKVTWKK